MAKTLTNKKITKKYITPSFRKFISVIVFAAILGAAIFVAAQLSSRQGVTPNAPESEPAASVCGANSVNKCGSAGGCLSSQRCTKGGIQEYVAGKPIYKYSCISDRSCNIATPTPYCSRGNLTACLYGCNPSTTGGTCKPKSTPTPTKTPTPTIYTTKCDPAVTLERCKGNQPQVCQNGLWVNNGKTCINGCAGAGICLSCKQGATRCSGDGLSVEKCNNGVYVAVKGCSPNKCVIQNGLVQCSSSDRIDACIPGDTYIVCNTKGCNGCPTDTKGYKCTCTEHANYNCSCGL